MKRFFKKFFLKLGYKITKVYKGKNKKSPKSTQGKGDFLNGICTDPFCSVPFAGETLQYLIENYSFKTVLDVGSGEGRHSDVFRKSGKQVTSIDFGTSIYYNKRAENHVSITGDYYEYQFDHKFDAIWASHVLEHQPNANLFLKKIHSDLKEGGVLAITVPPLKNDIVGGHVSLWNAGLLLYQLVLAGFNCKDVAVKSYGYNISVILKKHSITAYPALSYDSGDILKMQEYFPNGFGEPFNGNIKILNWKL